MKPAIIDLDWLDQRIAECRARGLSEITGLLEVRRGIKEFPKSFSLETLNLKESDIPTFTDDGVGCLGAYSDH